LGRDSVTRARRGVVGNTVVCGLGHNDGHRRAAERDIASVNVGVVTMAPALSAAATDKTTSATDRTPPRSRALSSTSERKPNAVSIRDIVPQGA
jgi:hypothetical protein